MKCPNCENAEFTVYEGGDINPHKVGTGFCATCGRVPVSKKAVKAAEDKAVKSEDVQDK